MENGRLQLRAEYFHIPDFIESSVGERKLRTCNDALYVLDGQSEFSKFTVSLCLNI